MIRVPTLFIVGAGASREFGLPIGRGLVEQIARALSPGNSEMSNFVRLGAIAHFDRHKEFPIDALVGKGAFMSKALSQAQSIDTFIDTFRHDAAIAVMAKLTIDAADRVIFLGFGFHQQNVALLTTKSRAPNRIAEVRSTGLGLSTSGMIFAKRDISQIVSLPGGAHVPLEPVTCAELINSEDLFFSR